MEVIQKNEAFKRIDGQMKFSYVQIFVRQDGLLYSGKWTNRLELPKSMEDLDEVKRIPTEGRGPEVNPAWSAVYIKTPSLLAYVDGNLEKRIAREVETCEILRKNPHPNIAAYYGYQETHGRVSGLCFKRYKSTLLETVNSQRLGIVHNDINPANIMLDEDGTLILIDLIAVDISGSHCATPKPNERTTGTTLLSTLRSRKMTSTLSKIYKSGWLDRRIKGFFLDEAC
ncbi:hypothetical protein ASPVEDRAFT_36015 [Aspergillus versicolor CBS 583.65]|uniref:Protein kinase domain-containing protein n=1 Tax=Aspergillus versicolor CBS 583.65 TaxID=1036611 RepID=A0A1L9P507_ASPVE|nr:uncharacterized protein ASPVEDRAFT_36015 [Aspergillus versicolor CBS 583.65]OJI96617.1 hypothetical protein ASPVEDRAFT_36015 [Aspergillus versicolor CBS 583.65]